jgi:hypothetical protein
MCGVGYKKVVFCYRRHVSFCGGTKAAASKVDLSWQVVHYNNSRVCMCVCVCACVCAYRNMLRSQEKSGIAGTERSMVVEESTELNCIIPSYVRTPLPRCRGLISESDYRKALWYDSGYRAIDISRKEHAFRDLRCHTEHSDALQPVNFWR